MDLTLVLIAVALLLLAGGLVLWQWAVLGTRQQASASHMSQQLRQRLPDPDAPKDLLADGQPAPWRGSPTGWRNLLLRAGLRPSQSFYLSMALRMFALPIVLALFWQPVAGLAALVALVPLNIFFIWHRASRRHRRMVQQLPDFLETVVRMMTVGNSLGAAFQAAADRTEEPLREILSHARRAGNVGVELDVALRQTARLYGIYELYLVSAIVGVAIRVGGRTDHVLERMSAFMRDLTQARNELTALSAETRLSAWILALLPLCIGAIIVSTNGSLILGMWADELGRKLLIGAFVLQIVGSLWLYRLSRLD